MLARTLGALLGWSVALALGGCASGSAPTRYFTPTPATPTAPEAAATAPYAGPPLEVQGVRIPASLDRPELVREVAPGELQVLDFDHWAAPLDRLSRQVLIEDLALRLPPGKLIYPGTPAPDNRGALSLAVVSFRIDAGTATMVATWTVRWPASPGTPAPLGGTLRLEAPAGGSAAATNRAWSDLLGQVADRVRSALAGGR